MKLSLGRCVLAMLSLAAAGAQPLSVYSEFARINAAGEVTAPEAPREILSPALVRNGFTSFQIVVQAAADAKWWLFVGQNPENAVKVTMYRESGDALEATLEPIAPPRQGAGTEVLWMDVWTAADARVDRIKVEPELHLNGDWVIYPVEARVMEARVMEATPSAGAKPAVSYLCPLMPAPAAPAAPTVQLQLRNAAQDVALAAQLSLAGQLSNDELARLRGFCDTPAPLRWSENYLRIRDYLVRLR